MNEETKKLFDAPWEVGVCEKGNPEFEAVFIASKTGCLIGRDMEEETANRLVRLPELYDALVSVLYEDCRCCLYTYIDRCMIPDCASMIQNGCPKKEETCFYRKYWKLLKKVRDGE